MPSKVIRAGGVLLDLLAIFVVPPLVFGLLTWLSVDRTVANVVAITTFVAIAILLVWRLVYWRYIEREVKRLRRALRSEGR